jgi:hypothetical protein
MGPCLDFASTCVTFAQIYSQLMRDVTRKDHTHTHTEISELASGRSRTQEEPIVKHCTVAIYWRIIHVAMLVV